MFHISSCNITIHTSKPKERKVLCPHLGTRKKHLVARKKWVGQHDLDLTPDSQPKSLSQRKPERTVTSSASKLGTIAKLIAKSLSVKISLSALASTARIARTRTPAPVSHHGLVFAF